MSIVGSITPHSSSRDVTGCCHHISVKEFLSITPASVIKALEADFMDTKENRERKISQEDIQFLQLLNGKILHNKEGHLEMTLPFREHPQHSNNKQLATVQFKHLKGKQKP